MSKSKATTKRAKISLHWRNFIFLTLAGIINGVGVALFLSPAHLYDGGFSGTSILLSQLTPLSMSIFLIIINFPFFIFGCKRLGVNFMIYSMYAITIYSIVAYLLQNVLPIDYSNGSPITKDDLLLGALFGGIISGIGSGLTIRYGGAIDGIEVMAVVFAKRLGVTVGVFVMSYNILIYVLAGILTNGWIFALYSVVAYAVGLKAVDFIIDGLDKAKSAFIITTLGTPVADKLSQEFGRGVTVMEGQGYYSKSDKTVLYCVVNRFEVNKLKEAVVGIDPQAFIVINDVTDSLGSSLRYERFNKKAPKKIIQQPTVEQSQQLTGEQTAQNATPLEHETTQQQTQESNIKDNSCQSEQSSDSKQG